MVCSVELIGPHELSLLRDVGSLTWIFQVTREKASMTKLSSRTSHRYVGSERIRLPEGYCSCHIAGV